MRKRFLLAISIMLIFGLSIAVFAYTHGGNPMHPAVCCCKDGKCPMKSDPAKSDECCDMPDCCCKKGDSCPMKKPKQN